MGEPAIVQGDLVTGTCAIHQIPNPATGAPQPAPPLPFSAPLTMALCPNVLIMGRPAAVVGSWGLNSTPHVGLHATDPFLVPTQQKATITGGSPTVFFGGKPAAKKAPPPMLCATPGQVTGTAATVLIG